MALLNTALPITSAFPADLKLLDPSTIITTRSRYQISFCVLYFLSLSFSFGDELLPGLFENIDESLSSKTQLLFFNTYADFFRVRP